MVDAIKVHTEEFFTAMGFEAEVEITVQGEFFDVSVTVPDAHWLIGSGGKNIGDLYYVLRLFLASRLGGRVLFVLDVNGYMRKKEEFLRELARAMADRVRRSREPLILKPMSPRERRIIHTELASFPDIVTESAGEDPERRLTVKPYP